MNVVLWMGNEANQKALAHKIASNHNVIGIVIESRNIKRKLTAREFVEKVIGKIFLGKINTAWNYLQSHYQQQFSEFPKVNSLVVENINHEEVVRFTMSLKPELIIVSGTRLIKPKTLTNRPPKGIINLHTGLSPYIKGGPNCTNWCIATEQFHLIGNTVMWIDGGIDTGNLIATEFTDLTPSDNLNMIHLKVMNHAHDLCIRALSAIENNKAPNVKQSDIESGKTYYTRQWNLRAKMNLLKNLNKFRKEINSEKIKLNRKDVVLVHLPQTN